jgi:DNA-binding MarR family transcriptional regulator
LSTIDPKFLFGFQIQDVARLMSRTFENRAGDMKVTRSQARVLGYVSQSEGASQSEIATLMDIQKITLTKLVDELEAMGLIERRPHPDDRRVRRLYLWEGTRPVLEDIWRHLSEVSDFALAALPANRREAFVQDMVAIRKHLILDNAMPPETLALASDKIPREERSASSTKRVKS